MTALSPYRDGRGSKPPEAVTLDIVTLLGCYHAGLLLQDKSLRDEGAALVVWWHRVVWADICRVSAHSDHICFDRLPMETHVPNQAQMDRSVRAF